MSSLPLLNLVGHFSQLATVITVLTNSLLIYLTVYHVKQISPAYKFMIIVQAQIGALFSICELFVRPFHHSFNASLIYFSMSNMFGASKLLRSVLVLGYSLIYQMIICFMAIQFIYRKAVIKGGKGLKYFKGWRVLYWIGYIIVFSVIWSAAVFSTRPDGYSRRYVEEVMKNHYGVEDMKEEFAGFVIMIYELHNHQLSLKLSGIIFEIGVSTVLLSQYIVMIYCGLIIRREINTMLAVLSSKKHLIQSQLFTTLILQITAPCLFHHIPAFVLFLTPFLNWKMSFPSGVSICIFSVYPAVDSWILMAVVTEYRMVMRERMSKLLMNLANCLAVEESEQDATTTNRTS